MERLIMDERQFEVIDYTQGGITDSLMDMDAFEDAADELEASGAKWTGAALQLPDNADGWGPFFIIRPMWMTNVRKWPVAFAWGKEIEEPWRHGVGIVVRLGNWSRVIGVWRKGEKPEMPEIEETDTPIFVSPGDLV